MAENTSKILALAKSFSVFFCFVVVEDLMFCKEIVVYIFLVMQNKNKNIKYLLSITTSPDKFTSWLHNDWINLNIIEKKPVASGGNRNESKFLCKK